jgi:hypothetical protein
MILPREFRAVPLNPLGTDLLRLSPHIEGMPEPLGYLPELEKFDDEKKRKILRDNVRELNQLRLS